MRHAKTLPDPASRDDLGIAPRAAKPPRQRPRFGTHIACTMDWCVRHQYRRRKGGAMRRISASTGRYLGRFGGVLRAAFLAALLARAPAWARRTLTAPMTTGHTP